jgi:hypothetical protein
MSNTSTLRTLKNGIQMEVNAVKLIMHKLHTLTILGVNGVAALMELINECQNGTGFTPNSRDILEELDLILDGIVHPQVRDVVLSGAEVKNLTMRIGSPFQDTPYEYDPVHDEEGKGAPPQAIAWLEVYGFDVINDFPSVTDDGWIFILHRHGWYGVVTPTKAMLDHNPVPITLIEQLDLHWSSKLRMIGLGDGMCFFPNPRALLNHLGSSTFRLGVFPEKDVFHRAFLDLTEEALSHLTGT